MLKPLPDKVINYLAVVFRRCLELGRVPEKWLDSKAIFIPKLGNKDRADSKSYRPISLTSFLFKTLEKSSKESWIWMVSASIRFPLTSMDLDSVGVQTWLCLSSSMGFKNP